MRAQGASAMLTACGGAVQCDEGHYFCMEAQRKCAQGGDGRADSRKAGRFLRLSFGQGNACTGQGLGRFYNRQCVRRHTGRHSDGSDRGYYGHGGYFARRYRCGQGILCSARAWGQHVSRVSGRRHGDIPPGIRLRKRRRLHSVRRFGRSNAQACAAV